jgi:hypothetical protein
MSCYSALSANKNKTARSQKRAASLLSGSSLTRLKFNYLCKIIYHNITPSDISVAQKPTTEKQKVKNEKIKSAFFGLTFRSPLSTFN